MKYLTVPEDVYTISAGSYKFLNSYLGINKVISYDSETNTSENFLIKLVNSITSNLNFKYNIYSNQNYYTFDFYQYENNNSHIFSLMSNTANISINNNWMYPLENKYLHINTYNFPITRTISIIINSNTLPIYSIPEITVDLEYSGSKKQLIIPSGTYNYSSFNQIFFNFFKKYSGKFTNYLNISYFEYTRYIPGGSIIIRDNIELNKYYGLLHMLITYPNNVNFDTSTSVKKFSCNMPPVYRSLHIPEGNYTVNGLVDYINTHSSYSYNINGVSSLSYTQFLAKVVDNDVIIYTNDNTEFFINPICSINKYKENNWSKEHKLCSFEEKIIYDIKPLYYKGQSIYLVPKFNLTNVSAVNLPDGLTINSDTGVISGTFTKHGNYNCEISCSEFIGTFTLRFKCNHKCKIILNKFNFE